MLLVTIYSRQIWNIQFRQTSHCYGDRITKVTLSSFPYSLSSLEKKKKLLIPLGICFLFS